jgi:hypothetical protein
MRCHICQAEAVARCYTCGQLMCAQHGKESCTRCSSGIAAGDPRPVHVSEEPLSQAKKPAWWRPQQAEEYKPPACYACQGLTRAVCRHCQSHYCAEHAGKGGLCQACGTSAWLGPAMLVLVGAAMLALLCWGRFAGY